MIEIRGVKRTSTRTAEETPPNWRLFSFRNDLWRSHRIYLFRRLVYLHGTVTYSKKPRKHAVLILKRNVSLRTQVTKFDRQNARHTARYWTHKSSCVDKQGPRQMPKLRVFSGYAMIKRYYLLPMRCYWWRVDHRATNVGYRLRQKNIQERIFNFYILNFLILIIVLTSQFHKIFGWIKPVVAAGAFGKGGHKKKWQKQTYQ